jgi:hypothetical protein
MGKRSSQRLAVLIEDRPVEAFEQLNVAARVVPLHNWFFLAAAFLTLGAFGAFSFWYQVRLMLEGRGSSWRSTPQVRSPSSRSRHRQRGGWVRLR